ncbi:hypothetical protein [Sinosporangium siamense]|nr:hypothetical protein [Sinosporangium siamense]
MDYAIQTGLILVTGVVLALVAQWRGWRPSLLTALAVGIGFRVAIMLFSADDTWQPVDFVESFKPAGEAVLNRQDPVLDTDSRWHFLPTIPYVYALLLWLGIPWEIGGRLVTVVADIVLIPLVGKLAGGRTASLRAFQYACNPLALLVASVHGQVEPVALVFGVAAFVVARGPGDPERRGITMEPREAFQHLRSGLTAYGAAGFLRRAVTPLPTERPDLRRALYAGLLMGLALCAKSWPIWLIPGMLLLLPGLRSRAVAFVATGIAPVFFLVTLPIFAGTSFSRFPELIKELRYIRPIVGDWGWAATVVGGNWELRPDLVGFGTYLIYGTILLVTFFWRRADPVDLTTAILLAFMIVTPRLGAQYLMWFMPFLVARPTRFAWPVILGTSLWAAAGYMYLTQFDTDTWWELHSIWARASIVLLPVLAFALPWERRKPKQTPPDPGTPLEPVGTKRD